jgi:hypothetical protein
MKQSGLMFFVKYPYATAIITTVWICSGYMVHRSHGHLQALPVIFINMVLSWILMSLSLNSSSS